MRSRRAFLSTPSARRATIHRGRRHDEKPISIHALREEGDEDDPRGHSGRRPISIHALREEGDPPSLLCSTPALDFYPRPPRGGRRLPICWAYPRQCISIHALREEGDSTGIYGVTGVLVFLSTPSARRATRAWPFDMVVLDDFYPRPPRGGRQTKKHSMQLHLLFLSTPSARRATLCR